jgi:hypothetical protein
MEKNSIGIMVMHINRANMQKLIKKRTKASKQKAPEHSPQC